LVFKLQSLTTEFAILTIFL
jgi:T-complex protein 1 subunit beta